VKAIHTNNYCTFHVWTTEEFVPGHGLVLLQWGLFCKINFLIENIGSFSATYFIMWFLSLLCVK